MSVPQSKDEAHPESGTTERQPGFSIDASASVPGRIERLDLDAPPDSLPFSYKKNRIWSIARDPHTLYFYWQLALPVHRFPGGRLAVAVHRTGGAHESTAILGHPSGTRFVAVSSPGTLYHLTLGFLPPGKHGRKDMLFVILQASVRTPPGFPAVSSTNPGAESGILSRPSGHSAEVLSLLFPNLAPGLAPAGSSTGFAPARAGDAPGRVPLPPERGGFLPPAH